MGGCPRAVGWGGVGRGGGGEDMRRGGMGRGRAGKLVLCIEGRVERVAIRKVGMGR
jgi:hypothetical protein